LSVSEVLVIGYGNSLRGDDGIGPHLARAVEAWARPHVRVLAVHQLTPELAEAVAAARRVVFLDAHADEDNGPVRVSRLEPADTDPLSGHSGDPRALLKLARDLYGRTPESFWVTVAARGFGLGEGLSPEAKAHCRAALEQIAELLE
jgi:hydrogenase maturation protease